MTNSVLILALRFVSLFRIPNSVVPKHAINLESTHNTSFHAWRTTTIVWVPLCCSKRQVKSWIPPSKPMVSGWMSLPCCWHYFERFTSRYDFLMVHSLEFKSNTIEWVKGATTLLFSSLFKYRQKRHQYSVNSLYFSTNAPHGEQNFIYQLGIQIPFSEAEVDLSYFTEEGNRITSVVL